MYVISILRIRDHSFPPKPIKEEDRIYEYVKLTSLWSMEFAMDILFATKFDTVMESNGVFNNIRNQLRMLRANKYLINAYDWGTLGIRDMQGKLVKLLSLDD